MSDTLRGRFVWHELLTSNPKAALNFYSKVIGWKTQAWDKNPSYTLLVTDGRPMAGTMALPEDAKAMGAQPNWLSYIGTPDVDRTAKQTSDLGGRILRAAADIPDVGRFAVLQDPLGAVFAAYTPKQIPNAGTTPGLGDFSWHELATTDWAAAFDFYQKLFGWEKTESMDMGPGGTYQMFGWKGHMLGGMYNKPPNMPGPACWLPYAVVADSAKTVEIVKGLGGKIVNGPMQVPGGDWIAQGVDLQGAMFAIHSKAAVAEPQPPARRTRSARPRSARPAKRAASRSSGKAARRTKAASKPKAMRKALKGTASTKTSAKRATRRASAKKRVNAKKRVAKKRVRKTGKKRR